MGGSNKIIERAACGAKKKIVGQWKIEFKNLVTSHEAKCPVGVVMWAP